MNDSMNDSMDDSLDDSLDCLVIGGGPAGLTAATYLARFRRAPIVIDAGASRAAWIPVSHNIPAFPKGLTGEGLLARLREQAAEYGAALVSGEVTSLTQDKEGLFAATVAGRTLRARRVLLATGGLDVEPELPGIRDAVRTGLIRYCPICDAYEAAGQKIGLIAYGKCRIREALLLRAYTADLTVLTLGQPFDMQEDERRTLSEAGIAILDSPIDRLGIEGNAITAWHMEDGTEHRFETVYSALGVRIRSGLATSLGAATDDDGALRVDSHQQTSIAGLYAAGDVVSGLSQVSVANGQAAIAATHMNASLPFERFGRRKEKSVS